MEATEAMKAMAQRIVRKVCDEQALRDDTWVSAYMVDAALAAIKETQEACARLADEIAIVGVLDAIETGWAVADKIRAGEHYALAGERRPSGCARNTA